MGTNYYELRNPITHIAIEEVGEHYLINIWLNHLHSGVLTVVEEELSDILEIFKSDKVIYHSFYRGGKTTEKVSDTNNSVLISGSNEIISKEKLEEEVRKNE